MSILIVYFPSTSFYFASALSSSDSPSLIGSPRPLRTTHDLNTKKKSSRSRISSISQTMRSEWSYPLQGASIGRRTREDEKVERRGRRVMLVVAEGMMVMMAVAMMAMAEG